MNELDHFELLIISALYNVNDSYYRTTYRNIQTYRDHLRGRVGVTVGDTFERFGERVFCYEFYHQLQLLIQEEKTNNFNYLEGAILQGEVEKMHILELVNSLGLELMAGEYSPDFLMHSPGTSDSHPYVIEVKCEHDVSKSKILTDLKKLNEFVTKFQYQRGIFISTNSQPEYISAKLNALSDEIIKLKGRDRIKVICKTNQESEVKIWQL